GLALQAVEPAPFTPNLGLHHGWCGTSPRRVSGDLGSSCPPSPPLHSCEPGPRVGLRGEGCLPSAGQGPEDLDVGGSHVSSPDPRPAHCAHSPPFPDGPCFCSPPGAAGEGPGGADDEGPVRRQGKVTVKYDRKELRKRLNLEEWILEQLTRLYDCQEEEIPELEIDVDELLDMESDDTRAARVKELLVDCYKPTEAFISGLLDKIRGMQKLSTPQKK
uniref:Protein phosphatase 1 regulatory subunit 14 n=1 Tax=Felis catus TaxID=9685 RepID=A0ABI8ANP7_FELCA